VLMPSEPEARGPQPRRLPDAKRHVLRVNGDAANGEGSLEAIERGRCRRGDEVPQGNARQGDRGRVVPESHHCPQERSADPLPVAIGAPADVKTVKSSEKDTDEVPLFHIWKDKQHQRGAKRRYSSDGQPTSTLGVRTASAVGMPFDHEMLLVTADAAYTPQGAMRPGSWRCGATRRGRSRHRRTTCDAKQRLSAGLRPDGAATHSPAIG